MKEELAKKALEYLDNMEVFVADQLPEFLNEIIRWSIYSNVIYGIIAAILMLLCMFACRKGLCIYKDDSRYDSEFIGSCMMLVGGIAAIIFFTVLMESFEELVRAIMAPKYHLIKLLRG